VRQCIPDGGGRAATRHRRHYWFFFIQRGSAALLRRVTVAFWFFKIARGRRDELKAMRNRLFERFVKNLVDTYLALEIKIIHDRVAESTEQMERK
jgi:hypothetical protein